MSEWRPIETAPRSGERLLLCGSFRLVGEPRVRLIGSWDSGAKELISWRADFKPRQKFYPTHWMPLPTPPAAS